MKFRAMLLSGCCLVQVLIGNASENTSRSDFKNEFFSLSKQEQDSLRIKTSPLRIQSEELAYWDKVVSELTQKKPLGVVNGGRLFAYLYNAQNAFADASYALTGSLSGSLSPISSFVIQLFFPNYKSSVPPKNMDDPFSKELTALLGQQILDRFNAEKAQIRPVEVAKREGQWSGKAPYVGIEAPSMKPWVLKSADEFRLPQPPPSSDMKFWKGQVDLIKKNEEGLTESRKERIRFWAGMTDPESGDWLVIADKYMVDHKIPLQKQLLIRAKLATAIFDATIATFDSKYAYMTKRPFMIDKDLQQYIPAPNHPSYPAGHSTLSSAAATVLDYYLPENKKEWDNSAEECGMSRIWAGIHFPIDHNSGKRLGKQIGEAVINR